MAGKRPCLKKMMFDIMFILSNGGVAQLVEHATHIRRVRGSNPCAATTLLVVNVSIMWPFGQFMLTFHLGQFMVTFHLGQFMVTFFCRIFG